MDVELVLINGERRAMVLPSHTDSVVNVLDRLDEWVQTGDGGWVQKRFIVEVRVMTTDNGPSGTGEEYQQLSEAADSLTDQAWD